MIPVTADHRADPDFDLVILGPDIGAYALARAFHQRYGVRTTVIARALSGPVAHSRIIDGVDLGVDGTRDDTLAALTRIGEEKRAAGRTTLLLGNSDSYSQLFTDHAEDLRQWYVVPALEQSVLSLAFDKVEFSRVCAELDIPTPRTEIVDFTTADEAGWDPGSLEFDYPVVAKAAVSATYEGLRFPGKQKIYKADDAAELRTMLEQIRAGGFRDRFLVQELIPGDDSAMRSITSYTDQRGEVTLLATAQVLLQEHSPLALGNPAAMITSPDHTLMDQAARLLKKIGFRGFGNFDVKVDPRDGVPKFFELNPRIGRNNFYVTAAGANVAEFIVADLLENRAVEPVRVEREILYSVVPQFLLRRYLTPELQERVRQVRAEGGLHHPLAYPESFRHRAYRRVAMTNHIRKFRAHYPVATDTGF